MKIKSYQVGGVVYTPFVPNQAQTTTGTSSATSSKSSSSEDGKLTGIKKEIVEILKSNGIPSDVEKFLSKANSFLSGSTSLSDMSLFGGTNDDYDLSDLVKIQKMANDVKWNKERHEKAVANLDDEDAWGEVAMDSRGYMYVQDAEGNIKTISATEYAKGFEKGEYQAITNEQLLGLREKYSQFAMNSDILNSISGTIGIKSVQDYLVGIVEKLGSTTEQGYASKKQKQIINGIEALMSAGPDGYYKITDEHQAKDAETALTYLYSQLSEPMKRTLRTTIAANGGDPAKDQATFIGMILTQHTDHIQKADFDSTTTKYVDEKANGSASGKYVEQTLPERYASGNGFGAPEWTPIMTAGQNVPMYVQAQNLGSVLQKDGKSPLGDANLEILLNEAHGIGAIVDRSSITFGDIAISWDDASKLMYEGDSNLQRVYMPAKPDGSGRLRPDFELQQTIDTVNKQIEGMTPGQIKSAIADIPGVVYNEQTGTVEAKNMHVFLTFSAVASDDTLGNNLKKSQYLHELDNSEDRQKKSRYNDAIAIRSSVDGKDKRDKTNNPRTTWWWGYNFFEGNVWIPLNDSIISAAIYNNQRIPQETYMNMSAKSQARQQYEQAQAVTDQMIQSGNLRTTF